MNWKKILKVAAWVVGVPIALFVLLVIARVPHAWNKQATDEQVAKIHATKLTLDDVLGKNLPPDPGVEADKTVAGVDANGNGIRDDVELAIFKEYPNSARTRAVLLQYALALQMEVTQPIVNTETVTAVAEETSRAYRCIGEITSRDNMKKFIEIGNKLHNFIDERQLNTQERKKAQISFYENKLGSYELPNGCDTNLISLTN